MARWRWPQLHVQWVVRHRGVRHGACLALAGGLIFVAHRGLAAPQPGWLNAGAPAPSFYDYQPSAVRQVVLEHLDAGSIPPGPGVADLEMQQRQTELQLSEQTTLASDYYGEIVKRDGEIAQLSQAVQSNQAALASVAQQLGLPKDQMAPPSPPAQPGVGGPQASDMAAMSKASTAPGSANRPVSSPQDLAARVKAYLNLPCPLPAGDPRCTEAQNHARQELARGHGLNVDHPDARPTMDMDIAQGFGPTDVDLEPLQMVNGQLVHFHDGLDLAEQMDEPVMAAGSGVVTFAGEIPSGANTIEITHAGGYKSVYMHEDQLLVTQGQHVQKGQIIGLIGMTGMATGPHLHFTIEDSTGNPIDPLPYIQ